MQHRIIDILLLIQKGKQLQQNMQSGVWSRSPSNFGWLNPEPKYFRRGSRSQRLKCGFPFSREILLGKRVVHIKQWFLVLHGPNRSGVGAKNFQRLEPETEIFILGSGDQNLSSGSTALHAMQQW